jgi:hypothetical protein
MIQKQIIFNLYYQIFKTKLKTKTKNDLKIVLVVNLQLWLDFVNTLNFHRIVWAAFFDVLQLEFHYSKKFFEAPNKNSAQTFRICLEDELPFPQILSKRTIAYKIHSCLRLCFYPFLWWAKLFSVEKDEDNFL